MRILSLQFTNLNSLKGTSPRIDFEAEPFASTGLFAITGPTGAGKTTLLDAITLALYGRAPRYDKDPNPESVMTRHTAECQAEVEFECRNGKFRATWGLRRARGKANGRVQNATRRIENCLTGEICAQSIRECETLIEELTGLDYERFLKSVMLAQGDFAAFLKANAKQRTELLQKVTGSDIYEQISIAAHEAFKEAKRAHDDLKLRQAEVKLLTPEELDAFKGKRKALQQQIEVQSAELQQWVQRKESIERVLELREQIHRCESELASLDEELEVFQPRLEALVKHRKISVVSDELKHLERCGQDESSLNLRLESVVKDIPVWESTKSARSEQLSLSKKNLEDIEETEPEIRKLFNEVRLLDEKIRKEKEEIKRQEDKLRKDELLKPQLESQLEAAVQSLNKILREKEDVDLWIQDHQSDAELVRSVELWKEKLSGWKSALTTASSLEDQITKKIRNLKALGSRQQEAEMRLKELLKSEKETEVELQNKKATRAQLVGEKTKEAIQDKLHRFELQRTKFARLGYEILELAKLQKKGESFASEFEECHRSLQTLQEQLAQLDKELGLHDSEIKMAQSEVEWISKVQTLEQHRSHLVDGEPCPLCGSKEHPFATLSLETNERLIHAKNKLISLEKKNKELQKRKTEVSGELASWKTREQAVKKNESEFKSTLEAASKRVRSLKEELGLNEDVDSVAVEQFTSELDIKAKALYEVYVQVSSIDTEINRCAESLSKVTLSLNDQKLLVERLKGELELEKADHDQLLRQKNTALDLTHQFQDTLRQDFKACLPTDVTLEVFTITDATSLLEEFAQRLNRWKLQLERAEELVKKVPLLSEAKLKAENALNILEARIQEVSEALGKSQGTCAELEAERKKLFSDGNVQEEEEKLRNALDTARSLLSKAQHEEAEAVQQLAKLKQSQMEIENSRKELAVKTQELQRGLSEHAMLLGYSSIDEMRTHLLPDELFKAWSEEDKRLNEKKIHLQSRHATYQESFNKLPVLSDEEIEKLGEIGQQIQQLNHTLNLSREELGGINREILLDEDNRQRHSSYATALDEAAVELKRWSDLNDLIGSSDGSKFARFAQSLTLDQLVKLANVHLRVLNPRYSILNNIEKPEDLELLMVDHYQADVVRPMESLSGGESFLTSLSLALGLSDLVGGKHRVQSLFIDEGFGTLDSQTLDIAMDALENLRKSDKTIGIISHVEALKERIGTQIQMIKLDGGISQLKIVA